jgi:hypothetical protein
MLLLDEGPGTGRHVQGVVELAIWLEYTLGGVTERSNVAALKAWAVGSRHTPISLRSTCKSASFLSDHWAPRMAAEGHRMTFQSILGRHRYVQRYVQLADLEAAGKSVRNGRAVPGREPEP